MRARMKSAVLVFLLRTAAFALASGLFLSPSRALAQVSVTISPTAINLPPGATQQFAAVVSGSSNTAVSWSVQESSGGTIDASGLYTAPVAAGAYHVIATSQADPTQTATATVALPGFVTWGLNTPRARGTATLLPDGKILFAGGTGSCASTSAEVYDPAMDRSTNTSSMVVARCAHTATLLQNGKVLLAGGQTNGGDTATAEIYDPGFGTFTPTGSMAAPRLQHTATLLSNGKVLMAGGVVCNPTCTASNTAELYDPGSGMFAPTGSMSFARNVATATLLPNGTVLAAGGIGVCSGTPTVCPDELVAEIYDPNSGAFSQTGTMVGAANEDASVLLPNGQVLFVGGLNSTTAAITAVAEIYDPASGMFTPTGSLNIPRGLADASVLSNGNVLISGGVSTTFYPAQTETYSPSTGQFTLTGSMQESRIYHTAIPLSDGEVLIAGGVAGEAVDSTEFYNPATGIFTSHSVFLNVDRQNHTGTQLADGRILISGGQSAANSTNASASAEIYDPATNQFTPTGQMSAPREYHTATLLPGSGKVLVVGGFGSSNGSSIAGTAELFDPSNGTFGLTGSPSAPRAQHTATLLQNGKVLIAGGQSLSPTNPGLTSAELYDPATGGFAPAGNMTVQRYGHTATLLSDGRVLIAGGIPSPLPLQPPITGASAEIYDPASGKFTPLASVSNSFYFPSSSFDSILLTTGDVLASLSFLFHPTTDTFTPLSNSGTATNYRFSTLPNGQVLVVGISPAELFDPSGGVIGAFAVEPVTRTSPTANLLSTGQVLVAGGTSARQVDFYQPPVAVPAASVASVSPNPVTGFTPVTITVQGANFAPGAVVADSGQALQTTFVSSAELTAVFPQSGLLLAGNHTIQVKNIQDARVANYTLSVVNPQILISGGVAGGIPFGNVTLGMTASQSVTVTNEGNATLTLNSFGISGTNSADFTVNAGGTTCPLQGSTLAPQASCVIDIQFAPSSVGLLDAELTASYQTPSSPMILPLTGTGVGVPAATVTPASLTFAGQNIGTTSAQQTITVTSTGTAALTIANIAATSGFQQTNNCPSSLAMNATCSVLVTFVPTLAGANGGTLAVTSNDAGSPHIVQLTGTGIGVSTSAIAPASLTFGNQAVGTSSAAQQVIVASIGSGNLAISNISLTETADFKETNNCPPSLAPSSNCSIAVTFAPASAGSLTGTLVVTANDGSPHTIPLSGTGTNFAIVPVTGSSLSATVPAGQPATYQMSLSPQAFSGTVNLSCSEPVAIPNATCMVSPSQTTLSGTAAVPVTVTVATTARGGVFVPSDLLRFRHLTVRDSGTARRIFFLAMLLALVAAARKSRRRIPLAISTVFLFALLATGCSTTVNTNSGSSLSTGTPAGTYQVVVTASAPGVTRTMTLTLNVQ